MNKSTITHFRKLSLYVLHPAKVKLFRKTDAYSSLERIKAIYETFRLSKEDKLYEMKRISPNSFSA
jgi:hypothetical protein